MTSLESDAVMAKRMITLANSVITVVPTKSDSDVIFCLQLLGKTLACTLHLS